ncbi:MAG: hypothetical protein MJZ11_06995 [Lachnospiraceae bacterium]|nr:hypothetical protein [Lachnospiraceae bacterium]
MICISTNIKKIKKLPEIKHLSSVVFYIALVIELLLVLIDKSAFINPVEGRMFQIAFALFFIKFLLTEYSMREYVIFTIFLLMGLLADYFGDRNEIIRFAVALFACKDIEIKKGFKVIFWIQTIGCVLIAAASIIGIYGELTVEKEYQGEGLFTRYCFGMGNANSFHTMFFVSVLLGLYLYNEIIKWWGYILLICADLYLFKLTDCKTATALTLFSILAFWIAPILKEKSFRLFTWISRGMMVLNIVLLLLSVYFAAGARGYCKYYWDSFWENPPNPPYLIIFFDKLLTGRILSLTEYDYHGTMDSWTWFTTPNHNVYFDLGWVRLFYWYGIILAVIVIIVLFYILYWLQKMKKTNEFIFVSFILFHMFVEAHFVSVYIGRSYVLFLIGMLLPEILYVNKKRTEKC